MLWLRYTLALFIALKVSDAVKVNMMGSLSLGKDVMGVLEDYVRTNLVKSRSGRRMLSPPDVAAAVKNACLCKDLIFCSGDTENLVNEYVTALSKAISNVFEGTVQNDAFEYTSKQYLRDVKKILKHANSKIREEYEAYIWTDVLKKISTALLERALQFATERLDPLVDKRKILHILTQHLVIAVGRVEIEHQKKLCVAHKICVSALECTKSLKTVLEPMKTMQESKLRLFVKLFHAQLVETPWWRGLEGGVKKEFERVLNDMTSKDEVLARDILLAVNNLVVDRLARKKPRGVDVQLINSILSDMDHIYNQKKRPFDDFLSKYDDWVKKDGVLEVHLKKLFKDMTNRLNDQPVEFTRRLTYEVDTFLALAVGTGQAS